MNQEKVDLLKKLENNEKLDPMDWAVLDALMEEQKKSSVELLSYLQDEEPSLTWRSELNEKLHAIIQTRPEKNRSWRFVFWSSTAATAIAAILFLLILPFTQNRNLYEESDTRVLLKWHEEAIASSFLPTDALQLKEKHRSEHIQEKNDIDDLIFGELLIDL